MDELRRQGRHNERGDYVVAGVPAGRVSLETTLTGSTAGLVSFDFDGQPAQWKAQAAADAVFTPLKADPVFQRLIAP